MLIDQGIDTVAATPHFYADRVSVEKFCQGGRGLTKVWRKRWKIRLKPQRYFWEQRLPIIRASAHLKALTPFASGTAAHCCWKCPCQHGASI